MNTWLLINAHMCYCPIYFTDHLIMTSTWKTNKKWVKLECLRRFCSFDIVSDLWSNGVILFYNHYLTINFLKQNKDLYHYHQSILINFFAMCTFQYLQLVHLKCPYEFSLFIFRHCYVNLRSRIHSKCYAKSVYDPEAISNDLIRKVI